MGTNLIHSDLHVGENVRSLVNSSFLRNTHSPLAFKKIKRRQKRKSPLYFYNIKNTTTTQNKKIDRVSISCTNIKDFHRMTKQTLLKTIHSTKSTLYHTPYHTVEMEQNDFRNDEKISSQYLKQEN